MFEEALELFVANKEKLLEVISHRLPMSEAAQSYALFDVQSAKSRAKTITLKIVAVRIVDRLSVSDFPSIS